MLFIGGIDNQIRALNLRKNAMEFTMYGHTGSVTGIALSNKGDFLVSNAMDNTVRTWDVRPFVSSAGSADAAG
jgi:Prp8 binding protein